jgi:hypothetical protein
MRGDLDRCNMTVTARGGTIHLTCDRTDGHDAEAFNEGFEDLAHYDFYQDANWMLLGEELVIAYRTDDTFDDSRCPPLIPELPLACECGNPDLENTWHHRDEPCYTLPGEGPCKCGLIQMGEDAITTYDHHGRHEREWCVSWSEIKDPARVLPDWPHREATG